MAAILVPAPEMRTATLAFMPLPKYCHAELVAPLVTDVPASIVPDQPEPFLKIDPETSSG
jgi:hypothetical protein